MSDRDDAMPDASLVQLVMKEAKDLVRSLEGTATSKVRISAGAFEIEVERGGAPTVAMAAPAAGMTLLGAAPGAPAAAPGVLPVLAPLVGVFYHSSSPGAKAFVQ